jgi:two-component system, cell cycle sensor histidine kinase and response regulator CckA
MTADSHPAEATAQLDAMQREHLDLAARVAGRVAHDFNNVLMVILGYSDLLKAIADERADGDVTAAVGEIERAAQRGAALTRQLSSLGRRAPATSSPVDVAALVRGLQRLLEHLMMSNVQLSIAADDAAWIDGDAGQLEQAVVNLAINARDAMPSGGTLRIEVASHKEDVTVTVSDTGVGMDATTLEHAFDPFFTTKRRTHGTGLGLPSVLSSMRQHRGEIELTSVPGQGTVARLTLPACGLPGPSASR